MTTTRIRPFLKWAGSKYSLINKIIDMFPAGTRLVEPFTGSAAVFMNTNYDHYLLGECNQDLINLYNILKTDSEDFIKYCSQLFIPKNNQREVYYQLRARFNGEDLVSPYEKAALFVYLNHHGYNGLCRYNSKGIYNVPFGKHEKINFPVARMQKFAEKTRKAEFICQDFRQTMAEAQAGDIIYCDPPYAPTEQDSNFSSYASNKFGKEEQIALAEAARSCQKRGISVIISNHDTEFTRSIYKGAKIKQISVKRQVSCRLDDRRREVMEVVALFRKLL